MHFHDNTDSVGFVLNGHLNGLLKEFQQTRYAMLSSHNSKKFDTKKDKDNKAPTARQVASSFASASVARAAKRPRRRRGGTYSNSVTNTKLLQWERDDFVAAKNGTYMYCAALMKDSYERYGADGEFAQGYQTVHEFVTNSNINKACTELMNGFGATIR
eukprot:691356_1